VKEILAQYRPLAKFLCIKAVVFFSYWQSLVISIMVQFGWLIEKNGDWSVSDVATGLQNFLICLEMLPLAIAHGKSFGPNSFQHDDIKEFLLQPTLAQRIIDVANVGDVLFDAVVAIKKGPKRHVMAGSFLEKSRGEQERSVIKSGWLYKRGEDIAKIWKRRYSLLITDPKGLIYFKMNPFDPESPPSLKARGFIDFTELAEVKPHSKISERFVIKTIARKWHFRAQTIKERDEWIKAIERNKPAFNILMDVPLD